MRGVPFFQSRRFDPPSISKSIRARDSGMVAFFFFALQTLIEHNLEVYLIWGVHTVQKGKKMRFLKTPKGPPAKTYLLFGFQTWCPVPGLIL